MWTAINDFAEERRWNCSWHTVFERFKSIFFFRFTYLSDCDAELTEEQRKLFRRDEPDNWACREDCVAVDPRCGNPGLSDQPCDYCYAYVCEKRTGKCLERHNKWLPYLKQRWQQVISWRQRLQQIIQQRQKCERDDD